MKKVISINSIRPAPIKRLENVLDIEKLCTPKLGHARQIMRILMDKRRAIYDIQEGVEAPIDQLKLHLNLQIARNVDPVYIGDDHKFIYMMVLSTINATVGSLFLRMMERGVIDITNWRILEDYNALNKEN
ncbi:MAG: hypothetical protein DRQ56_10840 [Gammaproteobacteria bacterium]|nr:MAG: hypothetical protein DRQ56_10840 [Gammaproteobacteria bacterium]